MPPTDTFYELRSEMAAYLKSILKSWLKSAGIRRIFLSYSPSIWRTRLQVWMNYGDSWTQYFQRGIAKARMVMNLEYMPSLHQFVIIPVRLSLRYQYQFPKSLRGYAGPATLLRKCGMQVLKETCGRIKHQVLYSDFVQTER